MVREHQKSPSFSPLTPVRYGEVVNINLVRDKKTGKSKGFCFICYEDQRSTILAVDNFNGIKVTQLVLQRAAFCLFDFLKNVINKNGGTT